MFFSGRRQDARMGECKLLRRPRAPSQVLPPISTPQEHCSLKSDGFVSSSKQFEASSIDSTAYKRSISNTPENPPYSPDPSWIQSIVSPPPPSESAPTRRTFNTMANFVSPENTVLTRVTRDELKFVLDPLYRGRTALGTYVDGKSLIKPFKPRGPDSFPMRNPPVHPEVVHYYDTDDMKYYRPPAFTLEHFLIKLSHVRHIPLHRVKEIMYSRENYKKLTKMLAEKQESAVYSQDEVHAIDITPDGTYPSSVGSSHPRDGSYELHPQDRSDISHPHAIDRSVAERPRDSLGAMAPRDKSGAMGPRDSSGAMVPQDRSFAQRPRDISGAMGPQDGSVAQRPRDISGAMGPQDRSVAQRPRDISGAMGLQDRSVAQLPRDISGAMGLQDGSVAQLPRDSLVSMGPQDRSGAETPKDSLVAMGHQDRSVVMGPRDRSVAQRSRDSLGAMGPRVSSDASHLQDGLDSSGSLRRQGSSSGPKDGLKTSHPPNISAASRLKDGLGISSRQGSKVAYRPRDNWKVLNSQIKALRPQLKNPDIVDVRGTEPRIPQHQLLIEMASMIKSHVKNILNTDVRSVIKTMPRYGPSFRNKAAPHTEIILYEDDREERISFATKSLQSSEAPGKDAIVHTSKKYFQGSERSGSPFVCTSDESISPSEVAVLDSLANGGIVLSLKAQFIAHMPDLTPLMTTLVYLNISFNDFVLLPQEILQLTQLEVLKLRNNPLILLPDGISQLKNLRAFVFSFCLVTDLPDGLFDLENLEYLDMSYNKLSSIPNEIRRLQNLWSLKLDGNQLPAMSSGCTHLKLKNLSVQNTFMNPIFWKDSSRNTAQRLTDIAALAIYKEKLHEKHPRRVPEAVHMIIERRDVCECCKGAMFGPGLKIIRPAKKMFGINSLPFIFRACSPSCLNTFKRSTDAICDLLYGD